MATHHATAPEHRPGVDNEAFRDVIGRFASGVTIITTTAGDADHGTTASAVSSLSLDPPMLLVCLSKSSNTQAAILDSGTFGVSILAAEQDKIAYQFATRKGAAKFDGVATSRGGSGVPMLCGALAQIECDVAETVTGGTHTVFLGRVRAATGSEGAPLAYFRGKFGRLESALDAAAYDDIRARVIERRIPVGERLDIEELARELATDPAHVYYALTKLSTDRLVTRREDHGYVVNPMTVESAAALFDARGVIELGVVHAAIGNIEKAQLDELAALAEALLAILHGENPDLGQFLATSRSFHTTLVGLAGCAPISDAFDRLGIPAFWTTTLHGKPWWHYVDVTHHRELVGALRAGDAGEARRLINEHTAEAKQFASDMISASGGVL